MFQSYQVHNVLLLIFHPYLFTLRLFWRIDKISGIFSGQWFLNNPKLTLFFSERYYIII